MVSPTGAASYQWAKVAGQGEGTFHASSDQNPQFAGMVRGKLTVQVTATTYPAGGVCRDTEELVVIEINDLTGPVTPQFMDQIPVPSGQYTVPYAANGELRAVLIAPIIDEYVPFEWETHFGARVNHQTGDVVITLSRSGTYVVKAIREGQNGSTSELLFKLYYNSYVFPKGRTKTGRDRRRRRRDVELVLIADVPGEDPHEDVARLYFGTWVDMYSVDDANAKIEAAWIANGRRPISVAIVDHGNVAIQGMGDGEGNETCKHISNKTADAFHVRDFTNMCRGKVRAVDFYGCNVAEGPEGDAWIQSLADLVGGNFSVTAANGEVTFTQEFRPVPGVYLELETGSEWVTKTPGP